MPEFVTTVPHSLGQAQARTQLESVLPRLVEGFGDHVTDMQGEWRSNELHYGFIALGMSIQGRLVVEEAAAHVHCKVPFAAMLFKGRIEQEIKTHLGAALRPIA